MKWNLKELDRYRLEHGPFATQKGDDTNGMFIIPHRSNQLRVLATNGGVTGWEHVSVSLQNRCPNWPEMCLVKDLFWDDNEVVIQFHPRKEEYVNNHQHCLHLWRKVGFDQPTPDSILTGLLEPRDE